MPVRKARKYLPPHRAGGKGRMSTEADGVVYRVSDWWASPQGRGAREGNGSRPQRRVLSVTMEASWHTEGARSSGCSQAWWVSSIVMSQLPWASQIPNFMLFMNNGSVVSTQPEEFKIKNVLLLLTLLKRTTERRILCILQSMHCLLIYLI